VIKFPPFVVRLNTKKEAEILRQICRILGCQTGYKNLQMGVVRVGKLPNSTFRDVDINSGLTMTSYKELGYTEVHTGDGLKDELKQDTIIVQMNLLNQAK
jgi:hypothetical protein